jgi:cytochrome P450 family 135
MKLAHLVSRKVDRMDVPKTATGDAVAANDAGAAASAGTCPVDHEAAGATSPDPAVSRPPTAIAASDLPGPRMPAPVQLITYWKRPAWFVEKCHERYGSRFSLRIRIPPKPLYLLSDPEDVKQMLQAPADVLHTGTGSAVIEKYTGQSGLAWLDEGEHKTRRTLLMPSMHGQALARIDTAIAAAAERDIAQWPRGETTALHPHIHRFTLNVIREVIFGSVIPSCWDELIEVLTQMMAFNNRIASAMMIHQMPPAAVRLVTAIRPLGLHAFLQLRERADELIAEAIEERRTAGQIGDDMLSVLLGITHDDGSPLTGREMRDEMMTIFVAGTETTAVALAWGFDYLSREAAARERLVAEIDEGIDDAYLTATVHEILRLRPSIPQIIPRTVMKPIEIGGVRYEPGMLLWASAYLLHRNPDLYPDPYAFRPERFVGTKPGVFTWIPFGGGRIRCLGATIALVEMKAVLREVLANCELSREDPDPEPPRSRIVSTMPAKGARLTLRTRRPQTSLAGG